MKTHAESLLDDKAPDSKVRPAISADYLGPGRVVEPASSGLSVEISDGSRVTARLAFAFPYAPALGDTLLVIGKGEDFYAIGVLSGQGTSRLSFPGGVEIHAGRGPLSLTSDERIRVAAPEVEIASPTVRVTAEALVEKLGSVYRRVRDLLHVRAKNAETFVDEQAILRAGSGAVVAEESVTVNGKQIHLG